MLMMNGMPRCSATCAIAALWPESKAPTSTLAPSWIRRSARVRAVSALLSVSAFMISMSTPSTCLSTAGAISAPFWQDWPISACTPERGSSTPTLSLCACALTMPNGDRALATPAAATLLLNCLRSIFPPPRGYAGLLSQHARRAGNIRRPRPGQGLHRRDRSRRAQAARQRLAAADRPSSRRRDAGCASGHRRHRRLRDSDAEGHHPCGGRRGHRLRDDGGASFTFFEGY